MAKVAEGALAILLLVRHPGQVQQQLGVAGARAPRRLERFAGEGELALPRVDQAEGLEVDRAGAELAGIESIEAGSSTYWGIEGAFQRKIKRSRWELWGSATVPLGGSGSIVSITTSPESPYFGLELEVCAVTLGARVENFFDKAGPIGQWMIQQNDINDFLKLPEDLKAFVCKPINRPFLELARKLSDYSTDKLRSVAEDILDITL